MSASIGGDDGPSPRCRGGPAESARRACRSSRRGTPGCRRTGCRRGDGRRRNRRSASRPGCRRSRAPRRRPTAPTRRCCRCTSTTRLPRFRCRTRRARNGVERPDALAGADVEAADVAGHVRLRRRRGAGDHGGAHDDDVAHDDRRRTRSDLAGLHDIAVESFGEIDDAVLAESRDRAAGLRVERDELVARRDEEEPRVVLAVGPVGEAAILPSRRRDRRARPRRGGTSRASRRSRRRRRRRRAACRR